VELFNRYTWKRRVPELMSILKWGVDHDLLGDRRFGQDSVAAAVAIAAVDFIEVLRRAKKNQ